MGLLATSRFLNDEAGRGARSVEPVGRRPSISSGSRARGARATRGRRRSSVLRPVHEADCGTSAVAPTRRLEELPSAASTRLRYRPVEAGSPRSRRSWSSVPRCRAAWCLGGRGRARLLHARAQARCPLHRRRWRVVDGGGDGGRPGRGRLRAGRARRFPCCRASRRLRVLGAAVLRHPDRHRTSWRTGDPSCRAPARGVRPCRVGNQQRALGRERRARMIGMRTATSRLMRDSICGGAGSDPCVARR